MLSWIQYIIKVNKKSLFLSQKNNLSVINTDEISQISKKYAVYDTDIRLLKKLLTFENNSHWNNAEIGSHIKYYRKPNIFERNVHYAMVNFHFNPKI